MDIDIIPVSNEAIGVHARINIGDLDSQGIVYEQWTATGKC
jgi:hypothetical protein